MVRQRALAEGGGKRLNPSSRSPPPSPLQFPPSRVDTSASSAPVSAPALPRVALSLKCLMKDTMSE